MVDLIAGLNRLNIILPESVTRQELLFLDEMLHWNKRINLTSIRQRDEAIEKHLIDSLVLLPYLGKGGTLLDMGSGGGLPGIPLAIAQADLQVISVDSVGKKINFQKHIKRKLKLSNLQPIQSRLENLSVNLGAGVKFDLIVARAFSSFETILHFSEPWLAIQGKVLVMKGADGLEELNEFSSKLELSGFFVDEQHQYQLPYSGAKRQLIVLRRKPG